MWSVGLDGGRVVGSVKRCWNLVTRVWNWGGSEVGSIMGGLFGAGWVICGLGIVYGLGGGSSRCMENNWAMGSLFASFWKWCRPTEEVGVVPWISTQQFL